MQGLGKLSCRACSHPHVQSDALIPILPNDVIIKHTSTTGKPLHNGLLLPFVPANIPAILKNLPTLPVDASKKIRSDSLTGASLAIFEFGSVGGRRVLTEVARSVLCR